MRTRRLVAIAITPLVLAAAASAAPPPSDSELAAKVDAIVAQEMARPAAVGLSVAVARGDRVAFSKGYGMADLEFDIPMNDQTTLRIGSVTKQFTAAAVMKLVEQGKLSLDDTLEKMLPDFPAQAKPITLRQILNHTSGIWSYTESEEFMMRDASLELTPSQLIDTFKNHALDFEPGSKWNYSNSGYYLLGEIIAKAAGKPYAEFVQEELFTPLGLTRTRYESNQAIIPNRAQGYSFDGKSVTNDRPIGADVPGAAGSLLSNASDLTRWSVALAGGKVVTPESYALMTTPAILPDGNNTKYGFGLKIDTWESTPRVSHGGGIFGFTSILAYYPSERLAVAVISNCEAFGGGRIAELISRAALGIEDFKPQDLSVTAEELARYVGEYKFETIPLEITFFEREGKLWGQASGQEADRLLSQGKGEFRASFDPNVKFVFTGGDGAAEEVTLFQRGEHKAKRKK